MRLRMAPFLVIAVAVVVCGLLEIDGQPYWAPDAYQRYRLLVPDRQFESYVAVLLAALAVGVAGRFPGLALGLLWTLLGWHWVTSTPILLTEVSVLVVGFACAGWGRRATVVLSGLSVPLGAALGVGYIFWFLDQNPGVFLAQLKAWGVSDAVYQVMRSGWGPTAGLGTLALLLLAVPWLAGLLIRSRVNEASSLLERQRAEQQRAVAESERDRAAELAHLREAQTQLSRDVHDVVGHSLTVILAQAEAAQFTQDPESLQRTLATITGTARSSLADVRQVLQQTTGAAAPVPVEADLQALLDGVRAGGRTVDLTEVGTPRPLPPDLAPVVHRVLQEMLTNAVRHGDPAAPIRVQRRWGRSIQVSVTNTVAATDSPYPGSGTGLDGMQRRVAAAGGQLDVERSADTFTVVATLALPGRQDL